MLAYPVRFKRDSDGTVLATVPDFPQAVTSGADEKQAAARIGAVIEDCIGEYITRRFPIPPPSPLKRGMKLVRVAPMVEMKAAIHQAMLDQRVSKTELARRLGWHLPQVDRVLDVNHASRLDQIEAALGALGKSLTVNIRDAA